MLREGDPMGAVRGLGGLIIVVFEIFDRGFENPSPLGDGKVDLPGFTVVVPIYY